MVDLNAGCGPLRTYNAMSTKVLQKCSLLNVSVRSVNLRTSSSNEQKTFLHREFVTIKVEANINQK